MAATHHPLLSLHTAVLQSGVAGLFGKWIAADSTVIVFGRTAGSGTLAGIALIVPQRITVDAGAAAGAVA